MSHLLHVSVCGLPHVVVLYDAGQRFPGKLEMRQKEEVCVWGGGGTRREQINNINFSSSCHLGVPSCIFIQRRRDHGGLRGLLDQQSRGTKKTKPNQTNHVGHVFMTTWCRHATGETRKMVSMMYRHDNWIRQPPCWRLQCLMEHCAVEITTSIASPISRLFWFKRILHPFWWTNLRGKKMAKLIQLITGRLIMSKPLWQS